MIKVSSIGLVGLVGFVLAACSVHVQAGDAPPPRHPAPPRVAAAPPPAPAPASRGAFGAMGHPGAPPPATHQVSPTPTTMHTEALNVSHIQQLAARQPKGCGFVEVVPGKWIKIDCHQYTPSARAIPHLSPRKAKLAQNHQLQWKPFSAFASQLRGGGVMHKPGAPTTGTVKPGQAGGSVGAGAPSLAALAGGLQKADSFPGTVDHRTDNGEGPVKDQGPVGSCTAFSLSSTIDNAAIRAGKFNPQSQPTSAASPNHVWSGYGIPQMGTAADATLGRTIATLAVWNTDNVQNCKLANATYEQDCGYEEHVTPGSWQSDPAIVAAKSKADGGGAYKVAGFEKLTIPPNTEELTTALASGSSLWIAMQIDGAAFSNQKMKAGVIPDWSSPNGGHALELAGYRDTPTGKQFLLHNSWGTSWGDGGYGWVSEAMVTKYMSYAYKVKLDGPPTPSGGATDDDCAPDELVDILSGLCSLICPNDTRPSNGCH